jgi:hypothetical protein
MGANDDVIDLMISMIKSSCEHCRQTGCYFSRELYALRECELLQGVRTVGGFLKGEKLIDRVMVGAMSFAKDTM